MSTTIFSKLAVILVCVLLLSSGCSNPKPEGFAIYLTKNDVPPAQMEALSHVEIADQPMISAKDIVTYNKRTHEITLNKDAFQRISNLEVPVRGKSFVVYVDKKPIYWGAFWTPISSISFEGVTVWKPLGSQGPEMITLELGYPSSTFYDGEDPRNNPEIIESLQLAGKLIDAPTITAMDELPHSLKGYELYSWLENNQWHFTLITGTNRNKTLDEIVAEENSITDNGWVKITVTGIPAIESVLSKVSRGEFIIWLSRLLVQTGQSDIKIQLPPQQDVNLIKEFSRQLGLDFQAQTP